MPFNGLIFVYRVFLFTQTFEIFYVLQKHLAATDPRIALRAAAILVRLISPPKAQETDQKRPAGGKPTYFDRLKAYIDAPMPGEPGHAEAMRFAAGVDDEDELEDDEDE